MTGKAIRAVLGYCIRDEHVLLIHRSTDPNRGLYTAPGGKIDPGEDPEQAVRRELMEESGLRVVSTRFVGLVEEYLPEFPGWIHHIFRCEIAPGPVRPSCAEGILGWFSVDDLLGGALSVPQADRVFNPWILVTPTEPFRVRFEYGAEGRLLRWERES